MSEEIDLLYRYGLSLLAIREISQKKLLVRLTQRGSADCAKMALDRLIQEAWVSDRRFAQNYTRYRSERGFGPIHIRRSLLMEGVSRELIDEAFEELNLDWELLLNRLVARKKKTIHGNSKDPRLLKIKLQRFLMSRGFSRESIIRLTV